LAGNSDTMPKLKLFIFSIIGLLLLILVTFAGYVAWGYYQMGCDFSAREQQVVRPGVDGESVAETGLVREASTTACIKTRKKRLFWWVRIPATKKVYLCEWQYGFSGFQKDDAVTLIHKVPRPEGVTDLQGYLVGRVGRTKDKSARISTWGEDPGK
jgi:hypothetical protein